MQKSWWYQGWTGPHSRDFSGVSGLYNVENKEGARWARRTKTGKQHQTKISLAENGRIGWIECLFVARNNPHSNWIPKTIIFSNSLPFWYCVTVSKGELHYNQRHQQLFNGHLHQTYQSRLSNKSECVNCLQWKAKIGLGLDNDRFILYWKIWSSQCTYLWSFNAYKFFCPTFPVWWNIASLSSS